MFSLLEDLLIFSRSRIFVDHFDIRIRTGIAGVRLRANPNECYISTGRDDRECVLAGSLCEEITSVITGLEIAACPRAIINYLGVCDPDGLGLVDGFWLSGLEGDNVVRRIFFVPDASFIGVPLTSFLGKAAYSRPWFPHERSGADGG